MAPRTPHLPHEASLSPLDSRYVDVETLPWQPTTFAGVTMKVLMEDKESGLLTALFKFEPGATLPFHEHVEIEQTFLLEGSVEDHEGKLTAGNYVWRPEGHRHSASSSAGALALSFFLKPNRFLEGDGESADQPSQHSQSK
jgi:anti-sigma factor ChrR (cupin superfamily)